MIHYDCVLCLANNALIDQEVVSKLPCTATRHYREQHSQQSPTLTA